MADGGGVVKGTVRPLADSISAVEAEKVSKHVQQAIAQQQQQLKDLERFAKDNQSLSELVLELPDAVSHRIMVPFGKAAFFPGRLIHTNEFLVLLGESYYAERSAKQTVELLSRRSELLDRKIADAKAQIADLEAESSFATHTAEEAKAGLVEIREEYQESGEFHVNQASSQRITVRAGASEPNLKPQVGDGSDLLASTSANNSVSEDPENDRIWARFAELELAEAADDTEDGDGEDNEDNSIGFAPRSDLHRSIVSRKEHDLGREDYDSDEVDSEEEGEEDDDDEDIERSTEEVQMSAEEDELEKYVGNWGFGGQEQTVGSLKGKPLSRFAQEVYQQQGRLKQELPQRSGQKEMPGSVLEKAGNTGGFGDLHTDLETWRKLGDNKKGHVLGETKAEESKRATPPVKEHRRSSKLDEPTATQLKPFTGKVAEHSDEDLERSRTEQVNDKQPSRPVSKFKMRQMQGGK